MRSKKMNSKRGGAHRHGKQGKELREKMKAAQEKAIQKLMAEQVPREAEFLKNHGVEDDNGKMFNHNLYDEYWHKDFDTLPVSANLRIQKLAIARMKYANQLPDGDPVKPYLISQSRPENIKRRWIAKRADEDLLNSYNVVNNDAAAAAAPANNERSIMNRVSNMFGRFGFAKKSKKGKSNKSKRGRKSQRGKKARKSKRGRK